MGLGGGEEGGGGGGGGGGVREGVGLVSGAYLDLDDDAAGIAAAW